MANINTLAKAVAIPFFFLVAPAIAQESVPEQTPLGDELQLGETVDPSQEIGATYTREVLGEWQMRCVRSEDGKDPCQLYQLIRDRNGNPTAEISMFPMPGTKTAVAGATLAVPLETLLTKHVTISIDGQAAQRYPFSWCTARGCFARIGLRQEDLEAYMRGAAAVVTIVQVAAPDKPVELSLSLSGFTAAFDAVKQNDLDIKN